MKDKKFYPWVVVGLLWVVALLNYMDRQMLSTMQEAMKLVPTYAPPTLPKWLANSEAVQKIGRYRK